MLRVILPGMLACLMTSIAFSQATKNEVNQSTFPFQLIGNSMVIQATVGNKTGSFVLDSGSPNLILNARYFEKERVDATNFRSIDLTGSGTHKLKKTSVHLRINNIEKRNQEAFLIDLSSIEQSKKVNILGVIGYPFLKHYEIVFDYQLKTITLFALDRKGERATQSVLHTHPDQVFDLKKSRHFLYLEAKVDGETLKLGLDCGAEISVMEKDAVRKFKNNFNPSHGVSLVSFNSKKSSVNVGSIQQIFIGNTELDLFEVIVMDLSAINRNLVIKLDGLLGNGFLSQHKIAINYKKKTLSIWDPAWFAKR